MLPCEYLKINSEIFKNRDLLNIFKILHNIRNPMDRGTWRATVYGVTSVGHKLVTKLPPPTLKQFRNSRYSILLNAYFLNYHHI